VGENETPGGVARLAAAGVSCVTLGDGAFGRRGALIRLVVTMRSWQPPSTAQAVDARCRACEAQPLREHAPLLGEWQ